ncbi:MAG: PD-(D/E)XK nuclease family protein, partial [Methanomicrobiales archaeon]|nr:PD-(D/E)XK nuclease family protein [Methanomicrobiales archaeon]
KESTSTGHAQAAPPLALSHNQISSYLTCPRRYYITYFEGIKQPTSGVEHRGIAIHAAIEDYLNAGEHWSFEELRASYEHHFSLDTDAVDWKGESPIALLEAGLDGLGLYYQEVLPKLRPAQGGVEVKFERRLGLFGKCRREVSLKGRVDAVMTNGTLVDHKSSRRSPSPWDIELSLQPTVYALGLGLTGGVRVAFGYLVMGKKKNSATVCTTERTPEDVAWLATNLLPDLVDAITNQMFMPKPGWHCNTCYVRKPCGYRVDLKEYEDGTDSANN